MKHVKESLGQFLDYQYFSLLEDKKSIIEDEKKLKQEEEKEGLEIIQKLQDNIERFKSAAGGKILKFKEFWEENKKSTESFDEDGQLYKMFDSDYVVGTLLLPDEALSDEEINSQIEEVDKENPETKDKDSKSEEKEEKEEPEEEKEEESEEEKEESKDKKFVKESINEEESSLGFNEPDINLDDEKEEGIGDSEEDSEIEGEEEIDGDEGIEGSEKEEGMEFSEEGESKEYFAVFDISGSEREEVFRTDSPSVIEKFKEFFENLYKGSMKEQIMKFKEAQEEKVKEAEFRAKEKAREEKKTKLSKFMKE